MIPNRHDRCPCGSGSTYENCCLRLGRRAAEPPQDLAMRRVRHATEGLQKRLIQFVDEVYGPESLHEAWDEFTQWAGVELDAESPLIALFLPWLFHCWRPRPDKNAIVIEDETLLGRPPTRVFLERRGQSIEPLARRYLDACAETPFSFHEVLRCAPRRGFRTRDVITDVEHDVVERTASETLDAGDLFYGHLVRIDGIVMLEACSPVVLPASQRPRIVELREHIDSRAAAQRAPEERLREWEFELRELCLRLMEPLLDVEPPVLHNTDGELVLPQRLSFDIDSADTAFQALKHLAIGDTEDDILGFADRGKDGRLARVRFGWNRLGRDAQGNVDVTVLGFVEISGARLIVDVDSVERAEAFRRIVAEALGARARYRGSEVAPSFRSREHRRHRRS